MIDLGVRLVVFEEDDGEVLWMMSSLLDETHLLALG